MVKKQLAMCIGLAFSCTMAIAGDDLGIRKYDINEFDPVLLEQVREISRNANAARAESGQDDMSWVSEMAEKAIVQAGEDEAQQNDTVLASADG